MNTATITQDEVIRFYCEPCETCVCVLCTFNEHRDHAISQFQDVAVKYKLNIEKLLESCKQKIVLFESHLEQINKQVLFMDWIQQQQQQQQQQSCKITKSPSKCTILIYELYVSTYSPTNK